MTSEKYRKSIESLPNLQLLVFSFKVSNIKLGKKSTIFISCHVITTTLVQNVFLLINLTGKNDHWKQNDVKFQWSVFMFVNKHS